MSHRAQASDYGRVGFLLDFYGSPARPLPPGGIEALLWVHVVVHRVDHHLQVSLRLHKAAHYAEWSNRLPLARQEAGDDRVVRTLARLDMIRVRRIYAEAVPSVLEADSRTRHYHA